MRFLSVGSHSCTQASSRQALVGLPFRRRHAARRRLRFRQPVPGRRRRAADALPRRAVGLRRRGGGATGVHRPARAGAALLARAPAAAARAGALLLAMLNFTTLLIAGHPWTITWAFTLWGAKAALLLDWDPSGAPFWSASFQLAALESGVLKDVTSIMDIGILLGALAAAGLGGRIKPSLRIPPRSLASAVIGGLLMGYVWRAHRLWLQRRRLLLRRRFPQSARLAMDRLCSGRQRAGPALASFFPTGELNRAVRNLAVATAIRRNRSTQDNLINFVS